MLHLFDTAAAAVVPIETRVPGALSIYLCGPTVYAEPHVGHGRLTLTWDVLRRYVTWSGCSVTLVSNVTDIDDKIIAQAASEQRSVEEVAAQWEARWWETMDRLGVLRPDHTPHATEWVVPMQELITELVERGHAYVGGDGVYFAAADVADYGLLGHQPLDGLLAGARVEVAAESAKRSPADFVLWKNAKPDEPWWESPWGRGRPGWHTECVAMAVGLLGNDFDLHGGGVDLAFPHHENERAQAVATDRTFTHHWVHSGMVVVDGGEKMARSAGNGLSLPDLLDVFDPRALRLLVLQSHYRSPMVVSPANLTAAVETVRGLDNFARAHPGAWDAAADADAVSRFVERMDDDFDTPRATALLFDLRRAANSAPDETAAPLAGAVVQLFDAVGLRLGDGPNGAARIPDAVMALVDLREQARTDRDWVAADQLRDALTRAGWNVEDTPMGAKVTPR